MYSRTIGGTSESQSPAPAPAEALTGTPHDPSAIHSSAIHPGQTSRRPNPLLRVVLAAIALVALAAIGSGLRNRDAGPVERDSPVEVVRDFLRALDAQDVDVARDLLAEPPPTSAGACWPGLTGGKWPIVVVSTRTSDRVARVRVRLPANQDVTPFGPAGGDMTADVELVRRDGGWLVRALPWELDLCPRDGGSLDSGYLESD